jgi:hypothetical protein
MTAWPALSSVLEQISSPELRQTSGLCLLLVNGPYLKHAAGRAGRTLASSIRACPAFRLRSRNLSLKWGLGGKVPGDRFT